MHLTSLNCSVGSGKMKIVFIISSLQSGGAERVISILANGLTHRGHSVEIICLNQCEIFYKIEGSVKVNFIAEPSISSNLFFGFLKNLRIVWRLINSLRDKKPNVLISFITKVNLLTIIANFFLRKPLLISERANPLRDPIGSILKISRFFLYRLTEGLVIQTDFAGKYFERFAVPLFKIYNPVIEFEHPVRLHKNQKVVLGVGRFTKEKGFDLLIEAFFAAKIPDWTLWLVGDGPERKSLESLASRLGIKERIVFWGRKENIGWFYENCGVFVLPSRHEGFPNSLLEAMMAGLPVIASDCDSGPSEVIKNSINGFLVKSDSVEALSEALIRLTGDPELRKQVSTRAIEVDQQFNSQKIITEWELLIKRITQSNF